MKKFIVKIQHAANQFGIFDFALFKIYLVAVGILFGVYFAYFFTSWIVYVWIIAALSCIFTITQLVRYYARNNNNNNARNNK